jgi:hypothetical protein
MYFTSKLIGSEFTVQGCQGIVPQFMVACFKTIATTCPPWAWPSGGVYHPKSEILFVAEYPTIPCKPEVTIA